MGDGRANPDLLRALRLNRKRAVQQKLKTLASLAALRNRDRMDVSFMLEIIQPEVIELVGGVDRVTHTIAAAEVVILPTTSPVLSLAGSDTDND